MKKVLFYSSVKDKSLFSTQKFYQIDISILENLGYKVILSNKIFDALKFWKYDLLFGYFFRYSFFPGLIARVFCKKVFLTGGIDSLDIAYASRKAYRIQSLMFKLCYFISTRDIIVSHTDLLNIKRINPNRKWRKLAFSEHTIDIGKFISNEPKERIFSTVGWLGNEAAVRRKGIDTSLRIFAQLKELETFKDYKFYHIGRFGEGLRYVKSLISQLGIENEVVLTGEISEEEKIKLLKKSEFYFQPSLYEGFGIAALEAFCAGNTLIHSGKGGLNNPIYATNEIIFNIDKPFDEAYKDFQEALFNLDKSKVDYGKLKTYYDNARRQNDLKRILES